MSEARMSQPRLYLALDTPDKQRALELAASVQEVPGDYGFKLNLDLLLMEGIRVVDEFRERYGRPIFTDTKTWNGGRTMGEIALNLGRAGSSLVNIYTHCGEKFMRRVMSEVRESGVEVDVYGLGVLTHYTDEDCLRLYGRSLAESVAFFAEQAEKAGLSGIIQPGTALEESKHLHLPKLVPAVRPLWYGDRKANAQEQTVTPAQAFAGGASTVVCGSPVFKSAEPAEALSRLLKEIS